MESFTENMAIFDSIVKANSVINSRESGERVMCSISGGKDSDIMLDLIWNIDTDNRVEYVWFDTGLEYQATKNHLVYLEDKYKIEIIREKPAVPIPAACKKYGQPFLSKMVSEQIGRLQNYGFIFQDKNFKELKDKYPKINSAIGWWCNNRDVGDFGYSIFNINYTKGLREFVLKNPPTFKISKECCKHAKKDVSRRYIKQNNISLTLTGLRKSEGGVRSTKSKCYHNNGERELYYPLFWYKNEDVKYYIATRNIETSDCYTKYGLIRTGCAACPFGWKELGGELAVIKKYEPRLFDAACHIFKDSYKYTAAYKKFLKENY